MAQIVLDRLTARFRAAGEILGEVAARTMGAHPARRVGERRHVPARRPDDEMEMFIDLTAVDRF